MMTTFDEYISYGMDRQLFVEALKISFATKNLPRQERIYVGVKNISERIPDGSDFGRLEIKADKPILLAVSQIGNDGPVYFYENESGISWFTGNGNATLSPWDCEILLREAKEARV